MSDVPIYHLQTTGVDRDDDLNCVVIGDESGMGSLWIDGAFHGDIEVPPAALEAGTLTVEATTDD